MMHLINKLSQADYDESIANLNAKSLLVNKKGNAQSTTTKMTLKLFVHIIYSGSMLEYDPLGSQ